MAPVYPSRLRKAEVEYEIAARGGTVPAGTDKTALDGILRDLAESNGFGPLGVANFSAEVEIQKAQTFLEEVLAAHSEDPGAFLENARYVARIHHWLRRIDRVLEAALVKAPFQSLRSQLEKFLPAHVEQISGGEGVDHIQQLVDDSIKINTPRVSTFSIKPLELTNPFTTFFNGKPPLEVTSPAKIFYLLCTLVNLQKLAKAFQVPDDALLKVIYPQSRGVLADFLLEQMGISPSWPTLISSLRQKFLPRATRERLVSEYYLRGQREGEEFSEYCSNLVLAFKALAVSDSEAEVVNNIGIGAKLSEVRSLFLSSSAPTSFADLERITVSLNSFSSVESQMQSPSTSSRQVVQSPVNQQAYSSARKPILCWFCKSPGHVQRQCRRYQQSRSRGGYHHQPTP